MTDTGKEMGLPPCECAQAYRDGIRICSSCYMLNEVGLTCDQFTAMKAKAERCDDAERLLEIERELHHLTKLDRVPPPPGWSVEFHACDTDAPDWWEMTTPDGECAGTWAHVQAEQLTKATDKLRARVAELEERNRKLCLRAAAPVALKDEASRAWVRISELERQISEMAMAAANSEVDTQEASQCQPQPNTEKNHAQSKAGIGPSRSRELHPMIDY